MKITIFSAFVQNENHNTQQQYTMKSTYGHKADFTGKHYHLGNQGNHEADINESENEYVE
jgi:hypothetical protein